MQCLSRRTLLRAAGVSMALPWLEAMSPALGSGSEQGYPRRFVGLSNGLGFHSPFLIPAQAGNNYKPSRYLKAVDDLRDEFTIISGTSHPGVGGGHRSAPCILTAAPYDGGNFRNSISLDQFLARRLGNATRFRSLVTSPRGTASTSITDNGSMIPPEHSPGRLFARLFIAEDPKSLRRQEQRLRQGRSIMDIVSDEARAMQRRLGPGDRQKLDSYFTCVRDLEKQLASNEAWLHRPKPRVSASQPDPVTDANDLIARQSAMLEVIFLAIQTDSTRFITMHSPADNVTLPMDGVNEGYHSLSHHGLDEAKISQLALIESAQIAQWGDFIRRLRTAREGEKTLLDRTTVLLTSNLGNASSHDTKNMPVLLAGGGFRHGKHLAFDQQNNYPLPNLFVSILQQHGIEQDRFASGTGTMRGLERS